MARSLKILVADDEPVAQLTLKTFLRKHGHVPLMARDGKQAVALFESESPDLVLMDVSMPVMDGYEATAQIRSMCGARWVPVIFLSADSESRQQVRGLDVGGDDYLVKPVNLVILEAKLRAMQRTVEMQRSLQEYATQLARYREDNESELRLAKHLMERLVRRESIDDAAVQSWIMPAQKFSGDVIAAARTPGGAIRLLLADGTGHGLGAALTVIPVIDEFYALTAKGFSIGGVVRRLNQQVRSLLPRERFVAATLVSINDADGTIDVWNGGNPEALFVSDSGDVLHVWKSQHPALGILPEDSFESSTEVFQSEGPGEFYMWSDGLVEAQDSEGSMFGLEGALAVLKKSPPAARIDRLIGVVRQHQGGDAGADDVSIVRARPSNMERGTTAVTRTDSADDGHTRARMDWRLGLRVGSEELKSADTLPVIIGWLDQLSLTESQRADLGLAVTELFANALDHGVLGLQSSLKEQPDGFMQYMDERAIRLVRLQEGVVEVSLEARARDAGRFVEIRVRDSGKGFDSASVGDSSSLTARSGRGMELVRSICERVEYQGCGNEVVALYRLR